MKDRKSFCSSGYDEQKRMISDRTEKINCWRLEMSEIENKIGRIRDMEEMSDGSIIIINDEYQGGVYRLFKQ